MNVYCKRTLTTLISLTFASFALAQTPPTNTKPPSSTTTTTNSPETDETAPRAASSPHQREATKTQAEEAHANKDADPAQSSSPHQRQATRTAEGKTNHQQTLNDCMKRTRTSNATMSEAQLKRTCEDQMKEMAR